MTLHSEARMLLGNWVAPGSAQEALRRRYVAHLEARLDGLTRDCYPDHLTASTLVVSPDGERVLLTLHAKARQWFQFGGHCEPDDLTLSGAALREALEESGLDELALDPVPVQLSDHEVPFCDSRGGVHHLDVRFVAVARPDAVHAVSEESLDVRWWPADRLPDPQPDLVELVRLTRARLQSVSESPGTSRRAPAE